MERATLPGGPEGRITMHVFDAQKAKFDSTTAAPTKAVKPARTRSAPATNKSKSLNEPAITWEQLAAIQPRLLDFLREAQTIQDDHTQPSFCGNLAWSRSRIRGDLKHLVGLRLSEGADPRLRTQRSYDVAYHKLYDALPPCRNCGICVSEAELRASYSRTPSNGCAN